jgi:signal transduction histidine kinase
VGIVYFVTTKSSRRRYSYAEAQVASDLVRRLAAALRRVEQLASLRRAVDETRASVRAVIHDLKDPTATIQMALSDILEYPSALVSLSAAADRNVRRALNTAARLQRVIDSGLRKPGVDAQSRVSHEASQPTSVRPATVLSQIVDEYRTLARRRGVALRLSLSSALPVLRVDPNMLGRVVGNLLGNALKFTPRGGRVTVAAASSPETVTIDVSDTGPGIEPQHAAKVFQRGWRGDALVDGEGLGLHIARELSRALGGELVLHPSAARGATFRLTLPVRHA